MRKLVLHCGFSPGDIVMLTAAVRDLHQAYPGEFLTDVRTPSPALWEHNPHLTPLDEHDPEVEVLHCDTPLIEQSNDAPYHYLHAFIDFLNRRLNLRIAPTRFQGDIHLSPDEICWSSQVAELTGSNAPFWIVAAGGKFDVTIKWWSRERYQAVIDHFRDRIQFVQVGLNSHYHPPLDGVIDLRGRTDLRQLVRLVHHAQGVLCPVTALMHLAAAVPGRPGDLAPRPCVVIAGGREPVHWEAYPGHQFIHTLGALPCCATGGCWRCRTEPLGDGNPRDNPDDLCLDVEAGLPRCMHLITPEEVIRRISVYFRGGVVRRLEPSEARAFNRFVAHVDEGATDREPLQVETVRLRTRDFLAKAPPYPAERHANRGIVICGGGLALFPSAYIGIRRLRQLGCTLPIQLWHLGPAELDEHLRALLQPHGVECVDAYLSPPPGPQPNPPLRGWPLKSHALVHCPFQEVLLLDADNVPVRNPDYLFQSPEYRATGTVFWHDRCQNEPPPNVWAFCGIPYRAEPGIESGQLLLDKARAWRALLLAHWYNRHHEFFYQHVYGDKETFHLAWRRLDQPYATPQRPLEALGAEAMAHHDFQGRRLFQHRNRAKWLLHGPNSSVSDFWFEPECRQILDELRTLWDGTIREFDARQPPRTPAEQAACAELVAHHFEYRRPDEPPRLLAFRNDALVEGGSSGNEMYWRIVTEDRTPTLQLASQRGLTFKFQPETPTVWTGYATGSDPTPGTLRRVAPRHPPDRRPERRPPLIQPVVISCTARATVLKRTLADFEETDWAGPQPWVVIDASPDPDPLVRILETGHRALETALATHPDYVLFLEDDLEFNRFIGSNLAAWPPVARGELSFATLYTPGSRANQGYVIVPAEQTICLEPTSVWGGQAYLIAAHTTRHILNAWNSAPAAGLNSDLRMPRLAGQFGLVLAHTPSLVNHAAVPSTWGGITHQALDFRRWWQSPRRPTHTSGNSHNSPTVAALATATDHTADAFWESCAAARVVTVALGQDAANWTPQTTLECVRRVAHEQSGKTSVLVIADATRVVCEPSLRSLQSRFASPDSPVVFGSNPGCGDTTCGPLPGGPYWIGKPEALAELANLSPPERESSPDQLAAVLTHRLQALGFTVEVDDNRRFGLRPRLG